MVRPVTHRPASVGVLASLLVIPQGAESTRSWVYAEGNPAGPPGGWPGSWRARMEVRTSRGGTLVARFHTSDVAADAVITLTTLNVGTPSTVPGVADGGTAAQVTLTVPASASSAWTWVDQAFGLPFDLELFNPGTGRVIRLLEGKVALSAEVTTGG
jgi:hypothetical protein